MADTTFGLTIVTLLFFLIVLKCYRARALPKNLPPSPPAIPIIGHLHLQKPPMFKTYHNLAQKYGPVFSLKYGSKLVVVVSSESTIQECFMKNDVAFADRPDLLAGKYLGYNNSSIDRAPYGEHWRNLRRIATTQFFCNNCLNMLVNVRKDEVMRLVTKLSSQSLQDFAKVELKSLFQNLTLNVLMRMITGKRYYGDDVTNVEEATEFKELLKEISFYYDASTPADFFPIWNWIDVSRYEKKLIQSAERIDAFLQGLVDECRNNLRPDSTKTALNNFLSVQKSQPEYFTDKLIKGNILILIAAGTDTTSATLEWSMACLLNHPNTLTKVREEIHQQIGQEVLLEEPDIPKLRYLQNVISEALRMYPASPIIDPHMSSQDCVVGGYHIPRGTMLLANAWSLHRDPTLWEDPDTFKAERFETEGVASKFMPFGMGRRSCPGINLANRVLGLTLGSLIQCFDWKRVSEEELDMTEGSGIVMPKAVPLEAMCKARPLLKKINHS
ncbi:hypothetical protein K2173_014599 [Erythroxylum novogranatense]|uniref:Cytochrome P450 n=1 Tax=Erythroxylum novogranatense TaxID=1862640 RepID=A0AAV8TF35_9ROSI|nr:hypothetical protein K2173_014599 [Erythroxylum novogranatense]